jgi:hypothetical protein
LGALSDPSCSSGKVEDASSDCDQQRNCQHSEDRNKRLQERLVVSVVDHDWVVRQDGAHDGSFQLLLEHIVRLIAVMAVTGRQI